ncbi:hypothetical protein DFH07DRAFT_777742 [Mycena maculata]|uniref:Uncharacterized protein n=1 Tax=Mycena maculata TaxID=230809 RepID=A0AAD7N378_9AGAR|nr:hypothetical protein DFH07DRAFT_777742 [Mycena maculata]
MDELTAINTADLEKPNPHWRPTKWIGCRKSFQNIPDFVAIEVARAICMPEHFSGFEHSPDKILAKIGGLNAIWTKKSGQKISGGVFWYQTSTPINTGPEIRHLWHVQFVTTSRANQTSLFPNWFLLRRWNMHLASSSKNSQEKYYSQARPRVDRKDIWELSIPSPKPALRNSFFTTVAAMKDQASEMLGCHGQCERGPESGWHTAATGKDDRLMIISAECEKYGHSQSTGAMISSLPLTERGLQQLEDTKDTGKIVVKEYPSKDLDIHHGAMQRRRPENQFTPGPEQHFE